MPNRFEGTMITLGDGSVVPYDAVVAQILSRYKNDQKNPSLAVKSAISLGIPEEVYSTFPGVDAAAVTAGKNLISSGAFGAVAANSAADAASAAPVGSAMYNSRIAAGLDAYGYPPEQVAALRAAGNYIEPAGGLLSSATQGVNDNQLTQGVVDKYGVPVSRTQTGVDRAGNPVYSNNSTPTPAAQDASTFKEPSWVANAKQTIGTGVVPVYPMRTVHGGNQAEDTSAAPIGYKYDNGQSQYVYLDLAGKPTGTVENRGSGIFSQVTDMAKTVAPLALAALGANYLPGLLGGAETAAGTGAASINQMVASGLAPGSVGAAGAASGLLTGEALAAAAGLSGTAATTLASTLGGGGGLLETATGGGGAGGVSQAALNEAVAAGTFTPGNLAAVAASNGLTTAELISAIVANPELLAAAGGLVTAGATPALVEAAATGAQNYIDAGGSSVSGSGGGPGGTDVFANQPVTLNEAVAAGGGPGAVNSSATQTGLLTGNTAALNTLAGVTPTSLLDLISGAGGTIKDVLKTINGTSGTGLSNLLTTGAGLLQGKSDVDAAKTQADAITRAAQIAADAAKFKPVGVTTAFGKSNFGYDANGNLISAGYELTPELAAQRDAILKAAGTTGMDWMKNTQTAGQGLFNLGQGYVAKTPEEAAANWVAAQQKVLQPAQDYAYAQMQQKLANTGRGGLSIAQGGDMGAANPEAQAYYNALMQQNNQLAAAGQAEGRAATTFGQGLMSGGLDLVSQGYNPYKTQFGTAQSVEQAGQNALDIGSALGGRAATAGANAGQTLYRGGTEAANATLEANAYNPYASLLAGGAKAPTIADFLNTWINKV